MSDEVVNSPVPGAQPVSEPVINIDNISGEQARALVEEAKAKGIEVEDLIKQKNAAGAPKVVPGAAVSGDIKEAAQEARRKLKIGDEEVDEEEVFKIYKARKEHQRASNKELHEGKAARKQAEDFINLMKNKDSLFDVIQKLGHDPRKLTEEYLASQLEDEMMDPRDKELRDAKKKLQHIEDMERRQKQAVEDQRNNELKAKYAEDYNKQFVAALSETGLPPTKPMVAEMAKYIHRSAAIGFKMTAIEAAQLVKEDIQMAHQRLVGDADGDMLMKLLGEDVANKIRKFDTSKVKNPEQYLRTPENQNHEPKERNRSTTNKRMSAKEWREFNRKK